MHTILTPYAIERVANWMTEKVTKTNIMNSKANQGAVTLKGHSEYEDKMLSWMWTALQVLTTRLRTDTREMPQGQCKLTDVSTAIGNAVLGQFMEGDVSVIKHLQVGDLILGAFHSLGYIDIYRDEGYSEHAQTAPYVVEATSKFADLAILPEVMEKDILRATTTRKIPDVSQMIQGHGRKIIKNADERHEADLQESIDSDAPWIQAANKLQQQHWRLNLPVYRVVEEQFEKLLVDVPPRPGIGSKKAVNEALKTLKANDTPANRDKFNHAVKLWNRELESLIQSSKNAEYNIIKIKAAELAKLTEGFYQFVELDYRGRVYYYEPLMNFQGSDMARGMMLFGEGKKLDNESGTKWLAIHTASSFNQTYKLDELPEWVTGEYRALKEQGLEDISVDKMTLTDRELWTYENMDMILGSTKDLVDCEKPVSFLACCLEWEAYLANPEEHLSYLPIPIDGSCNGYQHSAAIAKDEITGALVSLVPQDNQADLYVKAAQELLERTPEFFEARPDMKMKHIRKGIAKRAVMTRAYSAGKEKISDSMYRDCHQMGYTDDFDITMLDCMGLGEEVYKLIKDVCPGATRTMEFLQQLAGYELGTFETFDSAGNKVSKTKKKKLNATKQKLKKIKEPTAEELKDLNEVSELLASYETRCTKGNGNRILEWTTPTGFHVIYEAFLTRDIKVQSTIPGFKGGYAAQPGRIKHSLVENTPFPDVQKYQAGISPNFIHSMDASHMAYVISEWDGSFGAVHDSFSAHASDIEALAKLTRETFVDLYDVEDPYYEIANMILQGDGSNLFDEELPEMGSLDIKDVLKSQYFFC